MQGEFDGATRHGLQTAAAARAPALDKSGVPALHKCQFLLHRTRSTQRSAPDEMT
jgi:hypothetical protein